MLAKKVIYGLIIVATVLTGIEIWYITNVTALSQTGFMVWESAASLIILLLGMLLVFDFVKKKKTTNGILIIFGFLILDVLITMNLAPLTTEVERMTYYLHLMLTASIILIVGMIGNITDLEKKHREGFNITLHASDSPISTRMIIPTWIGTFLLMGMFVSFSG